MGNSKTNNHEHLYELAKNYVQETHHRVSNSSQAIKVAELPNLEEHQKYFPETFYYITDTLKEQFVYLSPSVESIFGIPVEAGQQMHAAEFMTKISHPEDLLDVLSIFEKFAARVKQTPINEIGNLRLLRTFRLKDKDGHYKSIVDQIVVLRCTENKDILNAYGAVSISPLTSNLAARTGVVIDSRTGEEIDSYQSSTQAYSKSLTKREIQVLRLLALGNKNKEVASKLFISIYTVETHRKNIMQKLGISNPVDLVWKALELKLLASKE